MKKITTFLSTIIIVIGCVFISDKAMGQAKCSTALPLTIGPDDNTCNSQTINTPTKLSNNTPPITTITGTACGLATGVYSNWFSFTGDGTTIRVKVSGENKVIGMTVFENQPCGASMAAKVCGTYPDDGIPHVLDVATINGASYLVAIVASSSTLSGKVCAFKTNGNPYKPLCDPIMYPVPTSLIVKTKDLDCFTSYNNVATSSTLTAPVTPCSANAKWWWGEFTATSTKTDLFLWGKDETNASIEVLEDFCGTAPQNEVFCNNNTGAKDLPNWGTMVTVPGKTYRVIVKSSTTMNNGNLCISSAPPEPTKPACTADMSFEGGNSNGWTTNWGSYHLVSAPGSIFTWDLYNATNPAALYQVTSGAGRDATVSFLPIVAPGGGNYSFRIGSVATAEGAAGNVIGVAPPLPHAAATSASYCFNVNAANAGFGYKYAVIMDYVAHPYELQPMFDVIMTVQATGDTVQCGKFQHVPNDGVSPFQFVGSNTDWSGKNHGPIYTPWTDVITDLSGYAGQTICVTFRVKDCEGGGSGACCPGDATLTDGTHWAYAYIDTYCIPMDITVPEFCAGAASIQICAPAGYKTYSWPAGQPGVTGPLNGQCVTITNPVNYAGTTYTVNMVSISGCPTIAKVILKAIPLTITTPVSICPNTPTNISVAVTNPINPPYTFSWSNGLGAGPGPKTVSPAVTTTYVVTVTNGVGCSSTQAVIVNVAPCVITATTTPATICNGGCGTVTASGSNGTAPYTYLWNTGAVTSTLSVCPIVNTTYTVTVTDASAKTASATAVVTVNPNPVVTSTPAIICAGTSTPLTASGATTYTWAPGTGLSATTGTTVTATPAATTTYTVTGTITATGCTGTTTVTVTVNPKPVVSVPGAGICPGGSTPLTASGATTYTWTPATGLSATTGTTVTANPAANTTYTVIGTTAGCTGSTTVIVTVGALVANAGPDVPICSGASTTLAASGGTGYSWTPATGLSNTTIFNPVANPAVTTTYTVTVTSGACTATDAVIVTVNPNPVISVPPATICAGTSTPLTASGATTYTWTPATGLSATTGTTVTANPAATSTYTVTGAFATGCSGVTTVIVTVNPKPVVSVAPATICKGNSTGLTASGATTYTWSPATGLSSTTGALVTANPIVTTTYTVIGTLATGCTGSTTVVVTVNPPCGPAVTATGVTVCNGICGTVTSTATGGVAPYTYSWNTGATTASLTPSPCPTVTTTYTITVTDNSVPIGSATATAVITVNPNPVVTVPAATICAGTSTPLTATGATTYTWAPATGLNTTTGGSVTANPATTTTYTVVGSFATGCTGSTTVTVTVNPIPVVSVANASICPGGSTPLTANGATTYTWSPGTGLSATTGTTVAANPSVNTTYTVIGTGVGGCTSSTTVTVSVGALVATVSPNTTICFGSGTQLTSGGGSIYSWTPATGLSDPNIFNPIATPTVTTTYTVVVSDATCSDDAVVTITVNPPITLNIAGLPPKCAGGTDGQAVVIPSGGTAPYTYTWTPVASPLASVNGAAGTYTVIVTDQFGCTAATSTVIVDPTPVTGTTSVITANCNQSDGSASATGNGGTGSYTYSWNTTPVQNTQTASNIPPGTYIVTIKDANGCPTTVSAIVPNAPGVVASASSTNVSCFGGTDGTATANGTAGILPYAYNWAPSGGNAATATGLAMGTYTVTITDNKGCTSTAMATITQPTKVVVTSLDANICPNATTTLTAAGSGGTGLITYSWSPGGLTGNPVTVAPTLTTPYTVTGMDANGCTGVTSITVTVQPTPVITVPNATICEGTSTILTAGGASTYTWSPTTGLNPATGSPVTANPIVTTTYTVVGTSVFGCTGSTTVIVTVNPAPIVTATGGSGCPGDTSTLSASGAVSYTWSPANSLSSSTGAIVTAHPGSTTNYIITGTGANGCTATTIATATVNPKPVASFTTAPDGVDIFNPTVYFYDQSSGGPITVWNWNLGDLKHTGSNIQNPHFTYPDTAAHYAVRLIVTNQFGCIDTVVTTVYIHGIFTFYIPNTFTPNGDGTNDGFLPKGTGIDESDYDLWVFDRWGNLIWHTDTWGDAWDGKANGGAEIAQIDTYVWKVHVKEKETGIKHNYIGHVNIVK